MYRKANTMSSANLSQTVLTLFTLIDFQVEFETISTGMSICVLLGVNYGEVSKV